MLGLLWVLFVVLNGRLTLEIALLGLVAAGLVFAFLCAYLEWSMQKEIALWRRMPGLILYALEMVWEILKANLATVRRVYSPRAPRSAIVTLHPSLTENWQRQTLANSITLTPGTITLECDEDQMVIHCLDKAMGEGLENSRMEQHLRRMGGKA
ncbi:MAG: Na+/H+ antiporter subunit E [Clostridia bacterium]|nr:Na+/H+ antiporter subunit E [Clostridia bacterium]